MSLHQTDSTISLLPWLGSVACPTEGSQHHSWPLPRQTHWEASEQSWWANSVSLCTPAFSFCRVECVLRGSTGNDPDSGNGSCGLAVHLLLQEVPNVLAHWERRRPFAGVTDGFGLVYLHLSHCLTNYLTASVKTYRTSWARHDALYTLGICI